MLPIITVALTATILGGVLPFLVRPLLHTLNMVDLPNERSSHTTPTSRGGGHPPRNKPYFGSIAVSAG